MKKSALYTLFFFSGMAGLGYEILWTRMLAVGLGHEIVSVLAVLVAFFGGLALGAWVLDRPASSSASPGRLLAVLELVIGLWSLALVYLLPHLNGLMPALIGGMPSIFRHWSIAFLCPFSALLPATAAMGGTLPAMDRFFEQLGKESRAVGGLYSVNTFGAAAGTLLTTFVLLPRFGMKNSGIILVLFNGISAACLYMLAHGLRVTEKTADTLEAPPSELRRIHATLLVAGLLGVGFEVLMVRALSQILENTVFSFAAMLVVYLLGTALGAGIYQKLKRFVNFESGLGLMLPATSLLCLVSVFLLPHAEPLFHWFLSHSGGGTPGSVSAEMAVSALVFLLPAVPMGATFSHLALALRGDKGGVGRALCLNTLGGAISPALFGLLLLPGIGLRLSLLILALLYLFLIPRLRLQHAVYAALALPLALQIGLKPDSYRLVSLPPGDTLVYHREGVMASVSVLEDARGERHLKVNNHFQMGGTTSIFSDRRQAYLPMLLHPNPKRALFLGLGSGVTFSAAADFGGLQADGVELVPEVIDALGYFEKATGDLSKLRNLHVINADARRYVLSAKRKYDVVVGDLFHPSRDGAGSLYTEEHFRAITNLLTENGIFCQWLPLYQLDMDTLKVIVRTFLEVFPNGQAYLAQYSVDQPIVGLVAGEQPLRFPEGWFRERVSNPGARRLLDGFGYDSVYSLLGTFLAGNEQLRAFAGEGPLNSDTFPVVLFQAPRFVYGNPESPRECLLALLDVFKNPDPEDILADVVTEEDYLARRRLVRYWEARNSYLKLGTRMKYTTDPVELYREAGESLLAVVRESVDFSDAYFPLISIAYEMYPTDRDACYKLLRDLERANPMRPEAGVLRKNLFEN